MRRPAAFAPFRNPRFSLFFAGQVVSHTGAWFQNLALSLVVLGVTGSAQALGGVTAAQFLPLVAFAVPAGRLADRVRPRTILLCTSAASAVIVGTLAGVLATAPDRLALVYVLIALLGTVATFERVAAQAIVFEIVGEEGLARAVAVSTIALAAARSIGPGLAGVAFPALGAPACMLLNAASFVAVLASVAAIRPTALHPRPRPRRSAGSAPSPLRRPPFVIVLAVSAVIALLALNLMLVLTSTVALTFGGDATAVGAVHALNAVGAIAGGLLAATRAVVPVRAVAAATAALGAVLLANAAAPSLGVLLLCAPLLGAGVGYYQGVVQAAAQSSVAPAQLGRAMSLITLATYGTAPAGAVLMGAVIDASSGRVALVIGGAAALACALMVALLTRRG